MRSKNAVPSKAAPPKHRTAAKRTADQGIFGEGRRNCIENNKDNFMSCTHFVTNFAISLKSFNYLKNGMKMTNDFTWSMRISSSASSP